MGEAQGCLQKGRGDESGGSKNQGFLVSPSECTRIHTGLQKALTAPPNSELGRQRDLLLKDIDAVTITSFGLYCEAAASLGGFYVW